MLGTQRRSDRPVLPRTCVGQWLRAALLRQQELADKLSLRINGGSLTGWNNDDEPAVIEAVIRSALGESDMITNDIKLNEKVRIYLIALVGTTTRLGIDAAALARVIVEAEQMAFERGWNPPLADG
jgi:hypothetical protein